jgi:hypothetical protein
VKPAIGFNRSGTTPRLFLTRDRQLNLNAAAGELEVTIRGQVLEDAMEQQIVAHQILIPDFQYQFPLRLKVNPDLIIPEGMWIIRDHA